MFSASRLPDIRRYGVTYITTWASAATSWPPRATDDHTNPVRVAFGNEASDVTSRRSDGVSAAPGVTASARRRPRSSIIRPEAADRSIGKGFPASRSTTRDRPGVRGRRIRRERALRDADAAIGELVNTGGGGCSVATTTIRRHRSTDAPRHVLVGRPGLPRRDGWIYLAGRTADWMRVDGENLTTAPIERISAAAGDQRVRSTRCPTNTSAIK